MSGPGRIYLDHAATGWPKSPSVTEAMTHCITQMGAAAGRGVYRSAMRSSAVVAKLRGQLARHIGAASIDCVSLHPSGTAAVNAALLGLLRPGDHVVTTSADHNAVLRPLWHLQQTIDLRVDIVDPHRVLEFVNPDTAMVAITGASNVTGQVLPVTDIARTLTDHRCIVLCDAAQTFGWIPIDVGVGIDVLAAPGHKAGGGPLGTGFLYVAPERHASIRPSIFGGTGSASEMLTMPDAMPDKLEAGNLNVPAIAGFSASLSDDSSIHGRSELARRSATRLHAAISMSDCHVTPMGELPIVSFWSEQLAAAEIAVLLDAEFNIEIRSGHHCAARVVDSLGGPPTGVARASAGPETTDAEIQALGTALVEILGPSAGSSSTKRAV